MGEGNELIIGFDILPSYSPRSKTAPKFAYVVFRNGTILSEKSEISRGGLLRTVRELEPDYLATDNIFEIVSDSKSLFKLVDRIPLNTKIIQVTGVPPKQIPLKTLARRHGFKIKGKPNPLESALLAAELASRGVGYTLECFSEQTEIKVTRGRKMGRGGQSANRYRRKIQSLIQQMTRHIEHELKTAEIKYDIDVRSSDFGYASARIVSYAPFPVIKGLIESKRGGDFNILVSPVRKRVEFLPLEPKPVPTRIAPKYFILGVDPGTTAAICLLTLSGKIHFVKSRKRMVRADILRIVYEHGIPVLLASDVPKTPHFVEKIASTVNADVYTPNKPIPVAEKNEIAREYAEEIKLRNAHERDALTAAVYAYRSLLPKLEQIDKKVRDEELQLDRNHLKALVIKGMPINEAIAEITREESQVPEVLPTPKDKEEPLTQETFDSLREKLVGIEEENIILETKLEDMQRLVEYSRFRESELTHSLEIIKKENYWKVKRDREVANKDVQLRKARKESSKLRKRIKKLRGRLEKLKGVKRLEMRGDMIAIKSVPHFSRESIEEYECRIGFKEGDIVLFEDASGGGPQTAHLLINRRIRAVVVDTPLSHLAVDELVKFSIPVIKADIVDLQRIDEFAFIDRKKFEQQLQDFIKEVKEKARQKSEDQLVELVEKYQREIER